MAQKKVVKAKAKVKVVKEKRVRERKPNAKDTPQETIDKLNETYSEWKTTKQISYDRNGKRVD
jgi:hypothetical protein